MTRAVSRPTHPPSLRPLGHTLIVGGTGMLAGASVALAARTEHVTSVARTRRSLAALDAVIADSGCGCVHHTLSLDWHAPERFLGEIERHVTATALPDLVVAWIHDDELALRLPETLATPDRPPTFVHVVGSASGSARAVAAAARHRLERRQTAVRYRQVILGANRSGGGVRWLTHHEISAGVLEAMERGQARFVVGTVS